MSRLFYHVMQDHLGNLLFNVSGTMYVAGSGTVATIYADEALTVPLPNPMTNHPSYGSFRCFLAAGSYDFAMTKAGYAFETMASLQGWGSMASQDADNVAITGGSASFTGQLGVQGALSSAVAMNMFYLKASQHGLQIKPTDTDTGAGGAVVFLNIGAVAVGSIGTNATATSYNTSSDARLKHAIAPLTNALDVVRALNPVAFRWRLDDREGHGLLAHEVAEVVDGVSTGEAGALDDAGNIQPMQIDYSKLVPYLIGAVKELTLQVEMLQAKLSEAGA